MGLIDFLEHWRGERVAVNGLVRLGGRSDDQEEEAAGLAEEDRAILEASRPPSLVDDLADLAARLQPAHRRHRKP